MSGRRQHKLGAGPGPGTGSHGQMEAPRVVSPVTDTLHKQAVCYN